MSNTLHLRSALLVGASMAAVLCGASAARAATAAASAGSDQPTTLGELVITAERHSENLQDTPIAVSAFSQEKLKAQRLDGGQNLETSVPNANFSRGNFGGYNFQIRGVGTKVVGSGGTAGVSFNVNELPVAANHFADTDFYDVQRVEVLRGPQGTLYGRNATGGAVNIITNQPTSGFNGSVEAEYGSYKERKLTGFVNFGLTDEFQVRLAGFWTKRDGFGTNLYNGHKIDGVDLGSIRATVAFKPNDKFSAYLMFEHFEENDTRNRVGKQLCIKDPGPSSVGGVATTAADRAFLTQGCVAGSLYNPASYGTLNSNGTLAGELTNLLGLTSYNDLFANHPLQNHNLHDIESSIDPFYMARSETVDLHMEWRLTDNLTLSSITGYNHNFGASAEDYNRLVPQTPFNSTLDTNAFLYTLAGALGGPAAQTAYANGFAALFPGGVVTDGQVGTSKFLRSYDYGNTEDIEWTQEFRLSSSFSGPLNFSGGVFYSSNYNPQGSVNYYVESNALTAFAQLDGAGAIPITYEYPPNGQGHNYYDARFGGILQSYAAFGEAYWKVNDQLKLTAGLRWTEDKLDNTQYPILLLAAGPPGFPTTICTTVVSGSCLVEQKQSWKALTGRFNVDWTPTLSFTDKTLIYASYSRGYKGGGFNTPCQGSLGTAGAGSCGYRLSYDPEFIDAFEIGTKNTLANGTLQLNGDFFYYNYKNYQISKIVAESSVNENINAKIYGVEFEGLWSPVRNLTLNANVGYLHTEITGGQSIDTLNLTQGNPAYVQLKTGSGANCIVDSAGLGVILASDLGGPLLSQICSGDAATSQASYSGFLQLLGVPQGSADFLAGGLFNYTGAATIDGVSVNLKGKELPNSPHWTLNFGAQYVFELGGDWKATLRGDYYWQAQSFARIYNAVNDRLKSWNNLNATLTFSSVEKGVDLQIWVKNLTNNQPLTDTYVTDATSGLFTNVFTLDPRTYGISLTKKF